MCSLFFIPFLDSCLTICWDCSELWRAFCSLPKLAQANLRYGYFLDISLSSSKDKKIAHRQRQKKTGNQWNQIKKLCIKYILSLDMSFYMLHIGSNMIIFHSCSIFATFLRWIFRGCFEFFVFMYKSKSRNRRVLSHTKWTSANSIWTNCCEFVDDDLELGFLFNFFQQIPFRLRKSRSNLEFTPLRKAVTFLLQTAFKTDFHNFGLAEFSSRWSQTHKIRFYFR